MATPYVGEIKLFAGNFAPINWAFCDGALLAIAEFDTLFNLIGTTYGGDGVNTFALPDLRGRVPVHIGTGNGLPQVMLGEPFGTETVILNAQQIPAHTHAFVTQAGGTRETSPAGNHFAAGGPELYASGVLPAASIPTGLASAGITQPHYNMGPYLAVSYIIALYGIYPSQT